MNSSLFFAFGDIETGGLNGRLETGELGMDHYPIFELAFIITDADLNPIGEPLHLIVHQTEDMIARSNPWAIEQHTKSGLLDKVRQSTLTLKDAEQQIIDYMAALGINKYDRKARSVAIFAGNSIMFDRDYIQAQMPLLHDYMHYRQMDVSGFALACRVWAPSVEEKVRASKTHSHLALSDISECIAEMRIYRDHLFNGKIPIEG